jgi:chromosome segregation ATPase
VIEDAMYFVAGVLVAGLAAMLVLPAFWRRALRLSARRVRLQAPLSVSEAIAERDQLRAEHSVAMRRLEQHVEHVEKSLAEHRAGLGRQSKRIVELQSQGGDQAEKIGHLGEELEAARCEVVALEADLGASRVALADLGLQLDRASSQVEAHGDAQVALDIRADEQRAAIAALETRAVGLEARLADQAQAAKLRAQAQEAGRARETQLARERTETIERRLAASEKAREDALLEGGRRLAELAARDVALLEKDRLISELTERLGPELHDLTQGPSSGNGDRALREAIARLGADVLRLTGERAESEDGAALMSAIGSRLRRESVATPAREGEAIGDEGAAPVRRARTPSPAR